MGLNSQILELRNQLLRCGGLPLAIRISCLSCFALYTGLRIAGAFGSKELRLLELAEERRSPGEPGGDI